MRELRLKYPVPLMSRIMSVSASGYYAWLERPLSKRAREEMRLEIEIKAAHTRTRQTYGAERLQCDLAENGIQVGICRIKRKFKATTYSKHNLPAVVIDESAEVVVQ